MEPQPDQTNSQKNQTVIAEGKKPETNKRSDTKGILLVVGVLMTLFGLLLSRDHLFEAFGAMLMGVGLIILLPGVLGLLYCYVRSVYGNTTSAPDSRAEKDEGLAFLIAIIGVVFGYCVGAWYEGGWEPSSVTIGGGLLCGFITLMVVFAEIR